MDEKTILVADDEMRMRRVIRDYLQIKGYRVLEATDGLQVLSALERDTVDLILLDVMMPHMNGFEACRRVRQRWATPVIFLTARGEEEDELQGFELGADEYIIKPFSLRVLLARVEAVLRRGRTEPDGQTVDAEGISINTVSREVRVDGRTVELTYTEYELLAYLMQNAGIALSRDRILDAVWRYDYEGDARTVDTHIKKLRNKLGVRGECIRTIRGVGYKLDPHPRKEDV